MNKNDFTSSECDDSKIVRDDDSVLSDRCWEEKYKGDSRKWLIRDGSRQKIESFLCSTMKDTYRCPLQEDHQSIGENIFFSNKIKSKNVYLILIILLFYQKVNLRTKNTTNVFFFAKNL